MKKALGNFIGIFIFLVVLGAFYTAVFDEPLPPEEAAKQNAEKAAKREAERVAEAVEEVRRAAANARLHAISIGQGAVQKSLRDPNSIEWESKAVNLDNHALCYIFRARNGFGGMNQGYAVIVDGKMHMNKSKTFDKHCPSKGNYETY